MCDKRQLVKLHQEEVGVQREHGEFLKLTQALATEIAAWQATRALCCC